MLKPDEWEELDVWRKDPMNGHLRFKQWCNHPTDENLVFQNYNKNCINGEHWIRKDSEIYKTMPKKNRESSRILLSPLITPEGKRSLFPVERKLTDEELEIQKQWRKDNPELAWRRGDAHPELDGVFFNGYRNIYFGGEYWVNSETWEKAQKRKPILDKESRSRRSDEAKERFRKLNSIRTKIKRETEPLFKLKNNIRRSISRGFHKANLSKNNTRTEEILGVSFSEFKTYIESLFEPWMNWENYGTNLPTKINEKWDLDHIIPVSTAETEEDLFRLNHYTNFQPLCSYVNRFIKKDSLDFTRIQ